MKEIIEFLIASGKLKKMPRTGWVWRGVKNPETIAEHTFRVAIMSWVLAKEGGEKLNLVKIIKMALAHDLCEVYAGDITPYWGLLSKDPKKRRKELQAWVRLPRAEKEKRAKVKFEREKKSLEKLVKKLSPDLRKEIMESWLDYEKMRTREGRFVKQVDKIETLLQAKEYWDDGNNSFVCAWWEEIDEFVDDPVLLKFLKELGRDDRVCKLKK